MIQSTATTKTVYIGPTVSDCEILKIADGICQDEVNVPECGFDGGDCCKLHFGNECQQCICHKSIGIPFLPCKYRKLFNRSTHKSDFIEFGLYTS